MERRLIGSNSGLSSHHSTSTSHIHRPTTTTTNSFIPTSASIHGHHVHGNALSNSTSAAFIPSSAKQHSQHGSSHAGGSSNGGSSSAPHNPSGLPTNNSGQSHPQQHQSVPTNGYFHGNSSGSSNLAHHHPSSQSSSSASQSMSHLQQQHHYHHSYSTTAVRKSSAYSSSALYGSSGSHASSAPTSNNAGPGAGGTSTNGGNNHNNNHPSHPPPPTSLQTSSGGVSQSSHGGNFYGITTTNSANHHQSVNTNAINGHSHHIPSHHQLHPVLASQMAVHHMVGQHHPQLIAASQSQHHLQPSHHQPQHHASTYTNGTASSQNNNIYGNHNNLAYHPPPHINGLPPSQPPSHQQPPETEGLPQTLVDSMRTLFDILDDGKQGKIRLSDIESRWESDPNGTNGKTTGAEPLIKMGVMGYLRKVTPPDGMLTFERFCAGLRLALVTNNNNTSPTNQNINNSSNNNNNNNNNNTNIPSNNHSNNNPTINSVLTKNAINSSLPVSTSSSSNTLPLPSSHSSSGAASGGSHQTGTFHGKSIHSPNPTSHPPNQPHHAQSNSNTLPSSINISKQSKLSLMSQHQNNQNSSSSTLQRSSKIPSLSSSSSSTPSRLPMLNSGNSTTTGIPITPLNAHSRSLGHVSQTSGTSTTFPNNSTSSQQSAGQGNNNNHITTSSHHNSQHHQTNHHNGIPHPQTNGSTSINSEIPSLSNTTSSMSAINPTINNGNNTGLNTTMKRGGGIGITSAPVNSSLVHHEQGTTIALVHHQPNGTPAKTPGIPTYSTSTLKISKQSSTPTLLSNSGIGRFLAKNGSLENLKTPSKDKIPAFNPTKDRPPSAPLLDNDSDHDDRNGGGGGGGGSGGGNLLVRSNQNSNSKDYYVRNNYGSHPVTHKNQSTTNLHPPSSSISNGNLNPNGLYTNLQHNSSSNPSSTTPSSNPTNSSYPVNINNRRERARSRDRDRDDHQHHHHHRHTHHSQHRPKYTDDSGSNEQDNQKRVNFVSPRQRTLSMPQLQLSKLKPKSIIHIDDHNSPPSHGDGNGNPPLTGSTKKSKINSISTVSLAPPPQNNNHSSNNSNNSNNNHHPHHINSNNLNNHNKTLPLPAPLSYISSIPTSNSSAPNGNGFNSVKSKIDISPTISNSSTIPISGSSSNGSVSGTLESILRSEKEYPFHYHPSSGGGGGSGNKEQPPPPPKPPRNALQNNAPTPAPPTTSSMVVTSNMSSNEIIVTEVPPLIKPALALNTPSPEIPGSQLNVVDSVEHTTVLSVNSSSVPPPPSNPPPPPSKPEIRNVLQTWQRGLSEKKPSESTHSPATTAAAAAPPAPNSISSASLASSSTNPSSTTSLVSTTLLPPPDLPSSPLQNGSLPHHPPLNGPSIPDNDAKQRAATSSKSSSARKRETPRRHTVQSGIDFATLKRLKQLEQEKDVIQQGIAYLEKAKDWYHKQLEGAEEKIALLSKGVPPAEYWSESYEERLNLLGCRVSEVNSLLTALMDGSSLPLHMDLQIPTHLSMRTIMRLKEQNRQLTQEVSECGHRVTQLETEKAMLLRQLFHQKNNQHLPEETVYM